MQYICESVYSSPTLFWRKWPAKSDRIHHLSHLHIFIPSSLHWCQRGDTIRPLHCRQQFFASSSLLWWGQVRERKKAPLAPALSLWVVCMHTWARGENKMICSIYFNVFCTVSRFLPFRQKLSWKFETFLKKNHLLAPPRAHVCSGVIWRWHRRRSKGGGREKAMTVAKKTGFVRQGK